MKKIFIALLLCTVTWLGSGVPGIYGGQEDQAVLEKIDFDQTADVLKTVINITGEFSYQHFELEDPSRLVVEIFPVGEIRTEEAYDINAFGVKTVRTGRFKPDTARIVFDLMETLPSYEIIQVANGIEVVFSWVGEVERVPPVTDRPVEREEVPEVEEEKETHLKAISYGQRDEQLKVDIRIEGDFLYRTVELRHFSQLILDLWPVPVLSAKSMANINLSGLREITVQKTGLDTVRVVLDFSGMLSSFKIDREEEGLTITFLATEEQARMPEAVTPIRKVVYRPVENTAVTFSFGSYDVSDHIYAQIYGGNTFMFSVELSRIFVRSNNHYFGVALGASRYEDTGSSTWTKEESTFTMIPYYFCIEYLLNREEVIPFLRVGLNVMSYKEKSEIHEVSGSSVGPHISLGLYIKIPDLEQLRLKFYLMWIGATAEQEEESINIGGIGAGIGITFGFNVL